MGDEAATCFGALPPMVTVTVSIDIFPLPATIVSSPHCAVEPPYCACCCTAQLGTPVGTVTVMLESVQVPTVAGIPPMVTNERALQLPPTAVHRVPNP